jgi:membrane associated rhomboid family serine protease
MLPIRDINPTRRPPFVTWALIAINVVVWLFAWSLGPRGIEAMVVLLGVVPQRLLALEDPMVLLTPITSTVMHAGWAHLLGNMWFLHIFGDNVEDHLGHVRYVLLYVLAAMCAVAAHVVLAPFSALPMVGASGAIAGVLGSHLVLYPRSRTIALILSVIPFRLPSWALLAQFFVFQWFSLGDQSQTAYVAHIYGFVAGMICGLIVRKGGLARKSAALSWQ